MRAILLHRLLPRCQLMSLRMLAAPCVAAPGGRQAAWRPGQRVRPCEHLLPTGRSYHTSIWRCQAAAGPVPEDLSLNATKRRQQELGGRVEDAIKVGCYVAHAEWSGSYGTAAAACRLPLLPSSSSPALSQYSAAPHNCRWPTCHLSSSGWLSWSRQQLRKTCGSSAVARKRCCSS